MDESNRKTNTSVPLSPSAIAALHDGNKLEAIKIVREEHNIGLKEAKGAVEAYVRTQPALESTLAAAQARTKQSALLWLVVLVGLGLFSFYFLFGTYMR